jgi:predicted transcriptional regulator
MVVSQTIGEQSGSETPTTFRNSESNLIMSVLKLAMRSHHKKRGRGRPTIRYKGGCPLKMIPAHEVVRLASEGATADYIAEFLNTTKPLLYRRFRAELDRGAP